MINSTTPATGPAILLIHCPVCESPEVHVCGGHVADDSTTTRVACESGHVADVTLATYRGATTLSVTRCPDVLAGDLPPAIPNVDLAAPATPWVEPTN